MIDWFDRLLCRLWIHDWVKPLFVGDPLRCRRCGKAKYITTEVP
jgi:hypothetical protein